MKKYWYILRAGFMSILAYRANVFLNTVSNGIYILMIYFLWKSIYAEANILNGLRFEQAFIYLAFASTIFNVFKTWTEWTISSQIISGNILKDITRPFDFMLKAFSDSAARAIFNMFWIAPPVVAVLILWGGETFIVDQLVFFIIALILAYAINFQLDFMVGATAFYTESIWGISLTKETLVLLLSGAVVPFAFFPDSLGAFLMYTPFPYIYHVPLTLLTDKIESPYSVYQFILSQAAWLVVICFVSRMFFNKAIKQITINGG